MSRARNIVLGVVAGVVCLLILSILRHFIFGGLGVALNVLLEIAVLIVSLAVGVRIYRYNQGSDEEGRAQAE